MIEVTGTFRFRFKSKSHWVLLVPKRIAQDLLVKGFVQAGFTLFRVKRYVYIYCCRNANVLRIISLDALLNLLT